MNLDLSWLEPGPFLLLGVAALIGFYAGRAARLARLPAIIGYMVLGALAGPSLLNIITEARADSLSFLTHVALGFVAFSIGGELSLASLKRQGWGIVSIIFAESFGAFFVVLAGVYLVTRDLPQSLIFASMAPASAPAGTVAVIQEYKAKGSLTQALYAVVGFDDGLAIIIFAFAAALARTLLIHEATGTVESILPAMWAPIKEIGLSLGIGGVAGFIFCQLVKRLQNNGDMFILIFAVVMIINGLALRLHLSLILTNMMVGFVLANLRREAMVRRVLAPLLDVMPLTFVLFFFLAGAHLQLRALPALGLVGIVYIICRSLGLIFGARVGGMFGGVEEKVKKYVGLGILSQAGVAIGLALMVREIFQGLVEQYPAHDFSHAAQIGAETLMTVTATCIFFEIIGPILAKVALEKAGEIPKLKPVRAEDT